jgi:hypothetical protein
MNYQYWLDQVNTYESSYAPWYTRGDRIIKRYKDDRGANSKKQQFNILWSNVQTLAPALYDREPNPNIERRYLNDDEVALSASEVLERSVKYFIKTEAFNEVMNQAVLDRLLPGRGTVWVRYCPEFEKKEEDQITSSAESDTDELYSENVQFDFVDVEDFGHTVARVWAEVDAVWRKAYLDRKELIERFPGKGERIPLDAKAMGGKKDSETNMKATIYEIWCKKSKKAYWIHKDFPEILDEKDDPLKLKGFFPCPKPIYATLVNKTLIPIPDYVMYQDQAVELDNLTGRIGCLTSALKVAGVYDASAEGVQKLLSENTENKLIPVDQWAMFAQSGGLKGVVDFLPIDQIAAVLTGVYAARDKVKQDIYEITGISDIVRGASNPNETLGAQELKGKYAGLRIGKAQADVARFSRDLVEIATEIIAEHFDLETIKQISGVKLLSNAEKSQISIAMQQYQAMAAQAQQMQQPSPKPPVPEKVLDLLNKPSWEDVESVIRQDMPRCFIIDIETDSTIKQDQDAEKAARTEFLGAVTGFMEKAAMVQDPSLKPVLMELLMFGVRGFKAGRELDSVFQKAMDDMKKQAEMPPQPNPAAEMAAKEAQYKERELELKSKELEQKAMVLDKESQLKDKELNIKDKEIEVDYAKHELSTTADVTKARMDAKVKSNAETALFDSDMNEGNAPMAGMMQAVVEALQIQSENMNRGLEQVAAMNLQSNNAVIDAITRPKKTVLLRDPRTNSLMGAEQVTE